MNDPCFKTRQVLNDLLEWNERTGSWDAPCWKRAREYRDTLFPSTWDVEVLVAGTWHLVLYPAFNTQADAQAAADRWHAEQDHMEYRAVRTKGG